MSLLEGMLEARRSQMARCQALRTLRWMVHLQRFSWRMLCRHMGAHPSPSQAHDGSASKLAHVADRQRLVSLQPRLLETRHPQMARGALLRPLHWRLRMQRPSRCLLYGHVGPNAQHVHMAPVKRDSARMPPVRRRRRRKPIRAAHTTQATQPPTRSPLHHRHHAACLIQQRHWHVLRSQ